MPPKKESQAAKEARLAKEKKDKERAGERAEGDRQCTSAGQRRRARTHGREDSKEEEGNGVALCKRFRLR